MPKRSNPFQRLATLIHERLGKDWAVTESHIFTDLVTGESREVDIVAQKTVATYPMFLSIECRDHDRPADVLWIEGMSKKHEHLPTSKLVLWSSSGFTKSAFRKAKFLKIEAISHADARRTDWARLSRELTGGTVKHVTPNYTSFIDVDPLTGKPRRLENVANTAWYNSNGELIGTVPALIHFLSNSPFWRDVMMDNTTVGKGNFYVECEPPEPWFTDLPEGGRAQIRRIGVGIETVTEKAAVETASAFSEGRVLTLASAKLAVGTLEVLIHESPDGRTSFQSKMLQKQILPRRLASIARQTLLRK